VIVCTVVVYGVNSFWISRFEVSEIYIQQRSVINPANKDRINR